MKNNIFKFIDLDNFKDIIKSKRKILFSKISFFYVFFSKNNKNLLHIKVKTIKGSIFYPSKKETMTKKEQTVGERIDQATHTISEKL